MIALRPDLKVVLAAQPVDFRKSVHSCRRWCHGFYAAIRLRISAWAPLLDASNLHHGRLQPILLYCCDHQGRPLLGTRPRKDGEPGDLSNAHLGIPAAVDALRQYWMPIRYKRAR